MFALPGRPLFWDPWSLQKPYSCFDASCGMPWGCDECNTGGSPAKGQVGPNNSAPVHRAGRCSVDQARSRDWTDSHGFSRQQQQQQQQHSGKKHVTTAHPEPQSRRPRTRWHQQPPSQAAPQPSTSSTSCSSYSTACDDTIEAMDVCNRPPIPPPTAADIRSYSSADTISSPRPAPATRQRQDGVACKPAAAPAAAQHQQQRAKACRNSSSMRPQAAATVIQAAWRMHRLARHRAALKQLAAAASQLRSLCAQLSAAAAAAAAGTTLSQKQYLELSEPVMKVLFVLDAVSCGAAVELRSIRKRLTTEANQLLDDIQAAYKAQPAAPAPVVQQS
ncbi:hypothetical protein COO60DRAFT_635437 [Scenedesmus sp. NREL 46B-D3]|nr:hypothetical protein COO60DRAFT_635437 [Scenedesmus sp. NREL 46B-D3]